MGVHLTLKRIKARSQLQLHAFRQPLKGLLKSIIEGHDFILIIVLQCLHIQVRPGNRLSRYNHIIDWFCHFQ